MEAERLLRQKAERDLEVMKRTLLQLKSGEIELDSEGEVAAKVAVSYCLRQAVCLSRSLSVCLGLCLSVSVSVCLCLSCVCLPACLPACLSKFLFLTVCHALSIRLSVYVIENGCLQIPINSSTAVCCSL